jgi:hypothetical protein
VAELARVAVDQLRRYGGTFQEGERRHSASADRRYGDDGKECPRHKEQS